MAGGGHGGHDHGGGHGGGGGGIGLKFDMNIGGSPMGVVTLGAIVVAIVAAFEILRMGFNALTIHISWLGLAIAVLLAVAVMVRPKLVGKILATAACLAVGALFIWITGAIAYNMYTTIDAPFHLRGNHPGAYLILLVSWIICLLVLAVPALIAWAAIKTGWWMWWGEESHGHGH